MSMGMGALGIIGMILYFVFIIGMLVLYVYCIVLFIKLSKRGIKALDIYINKNKNESTSIGEDLKAAEINEDIDTIEIEEIEVTCDNE